MGGGPVSGAGRAKATESQRVSGGRVCVANGITTAAGELITGASNPCRVSTRPVGTDSTRA